MTALDDFASRARVVRGIKERPSQFGSHPPAWWSGTREIAHGHRGQLEVRLTRAVMARTRDELGQDARVDYRGPGSDWVRLQLRTADDVELGMRLLRMAKKANRPAS